LMREVLGPAARGRVIHAVAETGYWISRQRGCVVSVRRLWNPRHDPKPYLAYVWLSGLAETEYCATVWDAVEWIRPRVEASPRTTPMTRLGGVQGETSSRTRLGGTCDEIPGSPAMAGGGR
jgi:hypothetical protein